MRGSKKGREIERWYLPARIVVLLEHIHRYLEPSEALQGVEEKIDYYIGLEVALYHHLKERGYRFTVRFPTKYPWVYYQMRSGYDEEVLMDLTESIEDIPMLRDRRIDDIRCTEETLSVVFV